ncbi:MAG TPA: polysaccharide biosynthesis C-terminal domain-containing protein, partial [Chitinophagales bacterium]|nr:polysaccharide biosynthesis C-terminal domain-containing protein [Chitinophagales bacterium]
MSLLYVNATSDYGNIFGLLMLSFINISIVYIFGTLLTANGSLKTLNLIAIGGVIINVILNLFLIPKYFASGAAVATVITQLFVTAIHIYLTYYVMQYNMRTALWVRAAFFVILYIGFCFLINSLPLTWPYQLFISMAGSLPLAIVLKILNPSELIPAFRNIKQ